MTVFVDYRERASNVARILEKREITVKESQLDVGDYVVSDRVGIERKTVSDFLNSIINQRIFDQLARLSSVYEKPVLILEGDPKRLYSERDMHANTIRGVLSSIAIDYGIPIIWTENALETAETVSWIAFREQKKGKRDPQIRSCKKSRDMNQMQEYLVAGLPNINSKFSRRLLEHFGNPKEIFSATEEKLMEVDGMGREKVRKIFDLLNCRYEYRNKADKNER
jgi:Fanconi anemia group M protein